MGVILLLGAEGYAGQAFAAALQQRRRSFVPLTREALDYTRFELLFDYVRNLKPEFVINAAGDVDAGVQGEGGKDQLVRINAVLPQTVAQVCEMTKTPWGQVSSGSIYQGAKVLGEDGWQVEPDPGRAGLGQVLREHPERLAGFCEEDQPNGLFGDGACAFSSGTKAVGEEVTRDSGPHYTWRLRLPFSEKENPANFLSRFIERYYGCPGTSKGMARVNGNPHSNGNGRQEAAVVLEPDHAGELQTVREGLHSLSQVDECARACLDLWEQGAAFGVYHVVNPGSVGVLELLELVDELMRRPVRLRRVVYGDGNGEQDGVCGSGCVLGTGKLERAGIRLRPVRKAVRQAVQRMFDVGNTERQRRI